MIGWLGAKIAANWIQPVDASEEREARYLQVGFGFSALVAGRLSMIFALVGGLIAGGSYGGRALNRSSVANCALSGRRCRFLIFAPWLWNPTSKTASQSHAAH